MKKILVLLSLLVIGLFLVSCAPKEAAEEGGEITEEVTGEGAVAGQAYSVGTCNDPDANSIYDVAQVFVKSTTTKGTLKWADQCGTIPGGKIVLKEGICDKKGKVASWQYDCSLLNKKEAGADYQCVDGACVNKAAPVVPTVETNCTDSDNTPVSGDQLPSLKIKGKVTSSEFPLGKEDYCTGNFITEGLCYSNKKYTSFSASCGVLGQEYTCQDGACVGVTVPVASSNITNITSTTNTTIPKTNTTNTTSNFTS